MKTATSYLAKNLTEKQLGSIDSRVLNRIIETMMEYAEDYHYEQKRVNNNLTWDDTVKHRHETGGRPNEEV